MDLRFTDTKGKMQHVTADVQLRRRGVFSRRLRLRRLVDRRLEGDRSLRHDADARSGIGARRPVLRADDGRDVLRRARALDRPALRARPALDRQEGRSLHDVARHRRQRRLRPGSRVLHLRRRTFHDRHRTTVGFKVDSHRAAVELRHRVRDGQPRPPSAHQGRLLPGAADRQRPGHPLRDALGAWPRWASSSRSTTTRSPPPSTSSASSSARWSRWPTTCRSTSTSSTTSPRPTARRRRFMPKPIFGDNGSGMHVPPVDLEGRPADVRRQQVRRPFADTCLYYIGGILKHAKAINAFTNPTDQLLQAAGAGLRGARAARLLGAQPLGVVPHPARHEPEGQARRGPLPGSGRQPVPRLRGDADGRPRRHPEQDRSRARRWTRTSTTCRRPSWRRSRRCAARCAKRSTASTRTATS